MGGTRRSRERKKKGEKLLYVAGRCGSGLGPLPPDHSAPHPDALPAWGQCARALIRAGWEPQPGVIK